MVKLIVTDMDGTLLDSRKQLPPDFAEVFAALRARGVRFAVASGRSFVSLERYLVHMPGMPDCICDNGAYLVEDGRVGEMRVIARDKLHRFLRACRAYPELSLILCGPDGTYFLPEPADFAGRMVPYFSNARLVDDLFAVPEPIFKVGVSDNAGMTSRALDELARAFAGELATPISGHAWMDVTDFGVSKGSALHRLQQRLGVSPEETMAFGDYYNDIPMLARARYSFVMENANPDMRAHARFVAADNNRHGVTRAIREYVLEGALSE